MAAKQGEQQQHEIMEAARSVIPALRSIYNSAIRDIARECAWKDLLIEAVERRLITGDMDMSRRVQMAQGIEKALVDARLEIDLVVHVGGVCYTLNAGVITL